MTTHSTKKPEPRVRKRKKKSSSQAVQVTHVAVKDLNPYANNAREHSAKQVSQIKRSIETFGFINPILVDAENEVIAGHGPLIAALELGLPAVPTIQVGHLSEAEIRAFRLADNRIAGNSTWEEDLLRIEISDLVELELGGELSFDVGTLGFETAEIDLLLEDDPDNASPEVVDVPSGSVVARVGDVWRLGRHRIICGSALDEAVISRVMADDTASLVLTDPPYNVPVQGHVRLPGKVPHKEFEMASGEMSQDEFTGFL